MQTVLFHDTVFGPIHSRRLGSSLGVNLLPNDGKICSFDCLYCEAGYNAQGTGTTGFPPRAEVARLLRSKLEALRDDNQPLDVITFSGNGEPTLHPEFEGVIDDTIALRNELFPNAKVSVLTNATMLHRPAVAEALRKVDNNILKLDSAVESTALLLDRPNIPYRIPEVVERLKAYSGNGIIQTMITRGTHNGQPVDNSTPQEVDALIEAYRQIRPRSIMIYSIDRRTPEQSLQQVPKPELQSIADRITAATGIPVSVA